MGKQSPKQQPSRYDYVRRRGQTLLSYITDMGPGFLVTIGFIDPGNIAANVVAGASFGYNLLWVVPLGTLILILFQEMAARLGVVSRACLSEAVCPLVGPVGSPTLGVLAFVGSASTVLAELLGTAVGLNLLIGLPLVIGGLLTAVVVGAVIWSQEYHHVEDLIVAIVGLIGLAYLVELFAVKPVWGAVAHNLFVPHLSHGSAYMAISVLGAIVMPSNLYLHSAIAQTRDWTGGRMRHEFVDTTVSMIVGGVINAAIIVVAAAAFYTHGISVTGLEQAADTLRPIAGEMARVVFAVALILAGLASAITGAMAGSYAVGGFFGRGRREEAWHHQTWPFRVGFLSVLAVAGAALFFAANPLTTMVFSQAVLGVLLPFTLIPLLILTGRRTVMREWANPPVVQVLGWVIAAVVIALNGYLIYTLIG